MSPLSFRIAKLSSSYNAIVLLICRRCQAAASPCYAFVSPSYCIIARLLYGCRATIDVAEPLLSPTYCRQAITVANEATAATTRCSVATELMRSYHAAFKLSVVPSPDYCRRYAVVTVAELSFRRSANAIMYRRRHCAIAIIKPLCRCSSIVVARLSCREVIVSLSPLSWRHLRRSRHRCCHRQISFRARHRSYHCRLCVHLPFVPYLGTTDDTRTAASRALLCCPQLS